MAKKKKKMPLILKVLIGILIFLTVLLIGAAVYWNYLLDSIHYDPGTGLKPADGEPPVESIAPNWGKDVYNILLIGEEAIKTDGNGRSDTMIVITLNRKDKTLKMTSFMRDLYVDVPGYGNKKMNSAFELGGAELLYQTFETNFNFRPDHYVKVGFDDFEGIIDELGGVEITLTANEAQYLNRTNYISKKENRTVVEGTQIMNGNQAVGYSRVRKVRGINGESDDFGRTARQRIVLTSIFDKFKSKSMPELLMFLPKVAALVTTDIDKSGIDNYIAMYFSLGTTELTSMRIPIDDAATDERVQGEGLVLVPDLEKNNAAIQEFIFGVPQIEDSITEDGTVSDDGTGADMEEDMLSDDISDAQ